MSPEVLFLKRLFGEPEEMSDEELDMVLSVLEPKENGVTTPAEAGSGHCDVEVDEGEARR